VAFFSPPAFYVFAAPAVSFIAEFQSVWLACSKPQQRRSPFLFQCAAAASVTEELFDCRLSSRDARDENLPVTVTVSTCCGLLSAACFSYCFVVVFSSVTASDAACAAASLAIRCCCGGGGGSFSWLRSYVIALLAPESVPSDLRGSLLRLHLEGA
jgi:hypothetical protein